jgi:hypothetical protein
MAPWVNPTSNDADNSSGSSVGNSAPAACNDWRVDDADSLSARANMSPLQMPDIRLQAYPFVLHQLITLLFWERSPYMYG